MSPALAFGWRSSFISLRETTASLLLTLLAFVLDTESASRKTIL
jgi:hypothetical protein